MHEEETIILKLSTIPNSNNNLSVATGALVSPQPSHSHLILPATSLSSSQSHNNIQQSHVLVVQHSTQIPSHTVASSSIKLPSSSPATSRAHIIINNTNDTNSNVAVTTTPSLTAIAAPQSIVTTSNVIVSSNGLHIHHSAPSSQQQLRNVSSNHNQIHIHSNHELTNHGSSNILLTPNHGSSSSHGSINSHDHHQQQQPHHHIHHQQQQQQIIQHQQIQQTDAGSSASSVISGNTILLNSEMPVQTIESSSANGSINNTSTITSLSTMNLEPNMISDQELDKSGGELEDHDLTYDDSEEGK